ncbi:hypothetical protein ACF061_32425 [Streptomyces sp. NPDC015220]|uniref:hypothetical protein n=1 Tax=Streptomyces sp. NPDC015220 TaxID=3364947 RepID=UPI0036FA62D5
MNTFAVLLGALAYLALGMAFLTGADCTVRVLVTEFDEDTGEPCLDRRLLFALWAALLVLWPLVAVYGVVPHVHYLGHRFLTWLVRR